MLGDTHRMLRAFRRNGYRTERTVDNQGNSVWNIYERRYKHSNGAHDEAEDFYVGKVVPLGSIVLNFGFFDLCFGRPGLYLLESLKDDKSGKDAEAIALQSRRALPTRYETLVEA